MALGQAPATRAWSRTTSAGLQRCERAVGWDAQRKHCVIRTKKSAWLPSDAGRVLTPPPPPKKNRNGAAASVDRRYAPSRVELLAQDSSDKPDLFLSDDEGDDAAVEVDAEATLDAVLREVLDTGGDDAIDEIDGARPVLSARVARARAAPPFLAPVGR